MRNYNLVEMIAFAGMAAAERTSDAISPPNALEYLKAHGDTIIIDVRLAEQFQQKHFTGAINLPVAEIKARAGEIPPNARVLLYCNSGRMALRAYDYLKPLRPDLDMVYIAGGPAPIDEYNAWKK